MTVRTHRSPAHIWVVRLTPLVLGVTLIMSGFWAPTPSEPLFLHHRWFFQTIFIAGGGVNILSALRPLRWIWPVYIALSVTVVVAAVRVFSAWGTHIYSYEQKALSTSAWTLIAVLKVGVALTQIGLSVDERHRLQT